MKFKVSPIEIPDEDPFRNDVLERKESAEILTQFITLTSSPFVLAIDSPWGSGKSTFLTMWLKTLEKAGFKSLFFNAWENDFSDSPLVSLIGEVGLALESLNLAGNKKTEAAKIFEKTKKTAASLVKVALPTVIKLATSGVVDLSGIDAKDVADLTEELMLDYLYSLPGGREIMASQFGYMLEASIVIGIRDWRQKNKKIEEYAAKANAADTNDQDRSRYKGVYDNFQWLPSADATLLVSRKIEIAQRFQ
jgi:hypothetical protein